MFLFMMVLGASVEPFLWYAAIVALDLKVVRLLAYGGADSYPRVLSA